MVKNYDKYQLRKNYSLTSIDRKVLSFLYLPIIGSKAYALYLYLDAENDGSQVVLGDISELMKRLNFTGADFVMARETLEACKLLTTFCAERDGYNEYIFQLMLPLDADKFFKNNLLYSSLKNKVEISRIVELKRLFMIDRQISGEFKNISVSFGDVFSVNDEFFKENEDDSEYISRNQSISSFSTEAFLSSLKEEIKGPYDLYDVNSFDKKDLELMERTKELYNLDYSTLAHLYNDSLTVGNVFSSKTFENKLHSLLPNLTKDYLEKKENMEYLSYLGDSDVSKKIKALSILSPNVVLRHLYKGHEDSEDYEIIEKLQKEYDLSPQVISVVLDRTLRATAGVLNKKYISRISRSLVYSGYTKEAYEAYYFLYNKDLQARRAKNQKDVVDVVINNESTEQENVSDFDFDELAKCPDTYKEI